MMPNTALALALLGLAGALHDPARSGREARSLSALAALVVLAIGFLTIAEYVLDPPFSIDQLLVHVEAGPYPGRPSPPTAMTLTLLAAAILVSDWRSSERIRTSEWLALCAGLLAFTFVVAQAFGAGPLYRLSDAPVIGVAVPTALSLLLISAGLLLEQPESRIARIAASRNPGDMMLRQLALALIVIAVTLGFTGSLLNEIVGRENAAFVSASLTVIGIALLLPLFAVTAKRLNRTHEALEHAHARSQELIELASDGIFIADLEGRYREVNEAGCRMLGYSREEIVRKTILDLIPPEDEARLRKDRERFLQGGTDVSEWRLLKKDGAYLPVEVSAKILPDGRWQGIVRNISERKRAADALRQAQERFELALRGADLATWDWNVKTGEVIFNRRWAELRGYQPEEISPRVESWSKGVHPDDWPTVQNFVRDCFEGMHPYFECEYRVATKSGEWIWLLDRGKVFTRDEQGKPTRMAGTELDVTARKRAEEALRLSEAKFSGIVSISADAIISIDEDQRILLFNEGAEKIFGRSSADVVGAPLDILIPERFRVIHAGHVRRFASGSDTARRMGGRNVEIVGVRSNGEEFPADAAISKLVVGGKSILTVALRDITEQKRIEKEQRLLADMGAALSGTPELKDTLSNVAQLIVRDLADYCIVDIVKENGSVERQRAVSRDATNNAVCDALLRAPPDRSVESQRDALLEELTPAVINSWARNEEDRTAFHAARFKSAIVAPLRAHGKFLGALTLISSTPSRMRGAVDLRVVEVIAQRAALFLQSSLLYLAAKRATQARDDVLGIVAHDIRNPLAAIASLAAVLEIRETEREIGEEIASAANRINRLIEDLLDVTRIEAGHLSLKAGRLPVVEVISDALEGQMPLASSASLELHVDAAPDLPDIWADHDRLFQVFANLIGNAIKFTKPGGRITLGATRRADEVLFSVSDTGCGIASSDLPHIFDRFWQVPGTARRGMGFGLAIVKGIVEAHGGRVWVESVPGRGSSFFFTIPTAQPRRHMSVPFNAAEADSVPEQAPVSASIGGHA